MKKTFTILTAAFALLVSLAIPMGMWGQTTYEQLTSIANIDESAQYVLGIDGTGFHYEGTSSWGKTALPSAQTPIYYTLTKATDGNSFTAHATISGTTYYLQIPTSNTFSMATSTGTNTDIIIGTTQVSGTNYAVANKTTTARHLRINGTSGLRSYAGTTGTMAYFYKVVPPTTPTISITPSSINFGDEAINTTNTETFTVTYANLTQDLTVSVGSGLAGVSVSPTTISYSGSGTQVVTVTYAPTSTGSISGDITVSNTADGLSETIAVTGSAYDPADVNYYEEVTSSLANWSGDYIFTAINNSNFYALTGVSNNLGTTAIVSVTTDGIASSSVTDGYKVTIAATANGYSLYLAGAGYLRYSGSSNNLYADNDFTASTCEWTISYANGVATITNVESNSRILQYNYNNGNPRFACYTSNQTKLTLFKYANANQVAMPTFSLAGGTYYSAQSVELSCATSGATIYYTTDGSTPTTSSSVYSTAIPVSATTTIKAFAVATGMTDSDVATATYTIELPLSTMDQIFARATEIGNTATAVRIAFNNWVVSAANSSSHTFVTDGTKGFMIYASNHGFAAGDILSGTVECNLQLYNGAAEVTGLTSTTTGLTVTTGGTVTVANIAMADLSGINTGALVSYDDLACSEETSGNYTNYYLTDGTTTIQAYHTIIGSGNLSGLLEDGKNYNITGVYCQNNNTKRVNPRGATDIEEVVPAPVSYYYSINGTLSAEQTCAVGSTKTLETGTDLYSNFTFAGWTTNANDVSQRLTEYTFSDDTPVTFYAVYAHPTTTTASSKDGESYVKVNSISEGDYLIVYEGLDNEVNDIPYIFNGLSSANGYVTSVYSNTNEIASVPAGAAIVTISAYDTGYSIQISSNSTNNPSKYIGGTSGSNTMNFSDSPILNTISIDNEGDADIISNTSHLRWNLAQEMFRYYKSASYDQQSAIQLYKKSGSSPVVVTNYYTRVLNETATADISLIGPSIIPSFGLLDMDSYEIERASSVNVPYLIIEEGGQLIYTGEEVRVDYQKNITAPSGTWGQNDNTGWYAISSPVGRFSKTSEIGDFEYLVNDVRRFDFFAYGEKCGWYNKTDASTYVSEVKAGHGYLYAREVGALISFADDASHDDYNLTNLSYTSSRGSLAGLHCIGNPYTHNIYKGVGITGDMQANYYALNEATGAWISTTDATAIVPTQAILVFVNKTDGTAAIHMTSNNSAPSSAKANNDYIKFNVANSKYEDVAYAWFDKGESLNKINHRNSEVPMLYIPQNNANYSIAYMSDNTQMFNLNFKAMTAGKYTLSVSEKGNFSYLHIYDRLTGEDVDMLLDSYTFIGSPADNEARFIVRLSYNAGNGSDINTFAFQNGSDIIVNGEGELQIFDVMGRMVKNTVINGVETIAMPQGVYIFRLNENIQKIVVR